MCFVELFIIFSERFIVLFDSANKQKPCIKPSCKEVTNWKSEKLKHKRTDQCEKIVTVSDRIGERSWSWDW